MFGSPTGSTETSIARIVVAGRPVIVVIATAVVLVVVDPTVVVDAIVDEATEVKVGCVTEATGGNESEAPEPPLPPHEARVASSNVVKSERRTTAPAHRGAAIPR
jgi:hypothetical protein